jgi:putative ABC transport system permease protein
MWWAWVRGNLRRRPGLVVLFVVEFALATLVVCTSFSFARALARWHDMRASTGLAELQVIEVWSPVQAPDAAAAQRRESADLAALRAQPGIAAASRVQTMPQERMRAPRYLEAGGAASVLVWPMIGGPDLPAVVDARLVAGRSFTAADLDASGPTPVILARPLAERLFAGDPVGQPLLLQPGAERGRVVGVAERIASGPPGTWTAELGLLVLDRRADGDGHLKYVVRGDRAAARQGAHALAVREPERTVFHTSAWEIDMENTQTNERAAWWALGTALVVVVIAFSSAIGMGALLSARRRRDIGILRALGASRRDVVRLFVVDHLVMASAGVLLGSFCAVLVHSAMAGAMLMMRLELDGLALTAALLLGSSGVAALLSCRRAASIPPHSATRTV